MKDFFPVKVWAKNVGVHYTQEHIIRAKYGTSLALQLITLFINPIIELDFPTAKEYRSYFTSLPTH